MSETTSCMTLDIRNAIIKLLKDDTYIGGIVTDGTEKIIRTVPLKDRIVNKYPAISVFDGGCNYDSNINSSFHTVKENFTIQVMFREYYSETNGNDGRYYENARDKATLLIKSIMNTISPKRTLGMTLNSILGFRFTENIPFEVANEGWWFYIKALNLEVEYQENLISDEIF